MLKLSKIFAFCTNSLFLIATRNGSLSYIAVALGMIIQNVLLFGFNIIVASQFGTSAEVDAFRSALTPPFMLAAVLAGVSVPLITNLQARSTDLGAKSQATLVGLVILVASIVCAGFGSIFGETILQVLHPGFDENRSRITLRLFSILIWMIPINTSIGVLNAQLNATMNFWLPALSGVLGTALTLAVSVVFVPSRGIDAVAYAVVCGGGLSLLMMLPAYYRRCAFPNVSNFRLIAPIATAAIPLTVGLVIFKADSIFDQYLLSAQKTGEIAQWDYACRILTPFLMLTSGMLGTVSFPKFSRALPLGRAALHAEIHQALFRLIVLVVPAAAVMLFFSEPLIRDLLQRKMFTAEDTARVASLTTWLTGMLVGYSLGDISSKISYATHKLWLPNFIFSLLLLSGFVAKWFTVPTFGVTGIAMVTCVVMLLYGIVMTKIVLKDVAFVPDQALFKILGQSFLGTLLATLGGHWMLRFLDSHQIPYGGTVAVSFGGIIYLISMLYLLKTTPIHEANWVEHRPE